MNLKHLGDALDHWKGSMVRWLEPALRDLHVVPMFTDDDPGERWQAPQLRSYARLLHVAPDRVLHPDRRFEHGSRALYFHALTLEPAADVFFDPDTGVEPLRRADSKHIAAQDLSAFLSNGTDRVLLVYQHAPRKDGYLARALDRLVQSPHLQGVEVFGYWAGHASMVFISRSEPRLRSFRQIFEDLLASPDRIVTVDGAQARHS